jgi:hypothetical protein
MKRKIFAVIATLFLIVACSTSPKKFEIKVTNPINLSRTDETFSISINKFTSIDPQFNVNNFSLLDGVIELSYQVDEKENGETNILVVANFEPKETKVITVKYGSGETEKVFTPRTYAGLSMKEGNVYYDKKFHGDHFIDVTDIKVPDIHTDHDALFRCEGPVWESEVVGYRFYLDWRNATDIFGKKITGLVLKNVGVTDTVAKEDSYHEMQDWGMDIFKVGNTLGIGSEGMMYDSKVYRVEKRDSVFCKIENGPVESTVETKYMGWQVGNKKYNMDSRISIDAGSRFTKNEIKIDNDADNFATGLAKYEGCSYKIGDSETGWNYISLWGKQTLAGDGDNLGIALLYPVASLKEISEDEINHIVVLKPVEGKTEYYFGAAWEQEPIGITTEEGFLNMLNEEVMKLNNPVVVE